MSTDVDVSIPAALLGNPGRARLVAALGVEFEAIAP
jgi:hypothetical protein